VNYGTNPDIVGETIPPPKEKLRLFQGGPDSPSVEVPTSDYLPRKALANPVSTGGAVFGFLQAIVHGLSRRQITQKDTVIRLSFTDINGKKWSIEHIMTGKPSPFPDLRGLEQQTRQKPE